MLNVVVLLKGGVHVVSAGGLEIHAEPQVQFVMKLMKSGEGVGLVLLVMKKGMRLGKEQNYLINQKENPRKMIGMLRYYYVITKKLIQR